MEAEVELQVTNAVGLHARPAALVVQTAARYESQIRIGVDHRQADAKSLLGLLGLGVRMGTTVHLRAEGLDAVDAIAALSALFASGLGDA
jgi:phosphotransferase system HPr (HPr) family protein